MFIFHKLQHRFNRMQSLIRLLGCVIALQHPFPFCVLLAVPEAKVWEEEFDLNSVRLCFQASITLPSGELFPLEPVVSQPIFDNSESDLDQA